MVLKPLRAPVRPRIVSPETGDALPLDETIRSMVDGTSTGAIELLGDRGAGKSTALAHLAAALNAPDRIVLLDEPDVVEIRLHAQDRLVVFTSRTHRSIAKLSLPIAAWTDDDVIEYLLATHPTRCREVMQQWSSDEFRRKLPGAPHLCRAILDQMANSQRRLDTREAIIEAVETELPADVARRLAGQYCLAFLVGDPEFAERVFKKLSQHGIGLRLLQLLGYHPVRLVLAARRIISVLDSTRQPFPSARLPEDLVEELARIAAEDRDTLETLLRLLRVRRAAWHPMVASVCHAAGVDLRPCLQKRLSGGYFDKAKWSGVDLSRALLSAASLNRADLALANLEHADLRGCQLRRASLHKARLASADLSEANLRGADLSQVAAAKCGFALADLSDANLEQAALVAASLQGTDLTGANCQAALLDEADLRGARIEGTEFFAASFENARLDRLPLRNARLDGASFRRARMKKCDLEFVQLPRADFAGADLTAALMTGSVMRNASFVGANLQKAGLADIEWEGASLQSADLRGCAFHMGSSRSGLVGSPYPGHGSRTGFYTDSYEEQHFKSPEEIRKANLCGADLRGARVFEADFYLVDLRGAKFDRHQAAHFRRCDAILENR